MNDYLFWLWGQITGELRKYQAPIKRSLCCQLRYDDSPNTGDLVRIKLDKVLPGWFQADVCYRRKYEIILYTLDSREVACEFTGGHTLRNFQVAVMRLKPMYVRQTLYRDDVVLESSWQ